MAAKKSRKKQSTQSISDFGGSTASFHENSIVKPKQRSSKVPYIIVGIGLILLAIFAVNKGWVVSAMVNGKPIFRVQLTQSLMSRYGNQTLEGMISEQIISDEGKKAGIIITQKDIDQKEKEILDSFGGNVSLEDLLTYQGMTKKDFDNQVKVQLLVYGLLGKDVTISDEEINAFIQNNASSLVATTEAEMKAEAKAALMDQKINEKVQPWFEEVKAKANIFRFNNSTN